MNTLSHALRAAEFAVTAELALTPKQTAADIVAAAKRLQTVTDAVQIPDHRYARPHISPVAVAAHLLAAGLDPVVRMNCRDRNRLAVQSELLAAQSFGVTNLILARGSDLPADHRPKTTGIYDLSAIDLIRTAAAISAGEVMVGDRQDNAPEFFIGTVATAFKPDDNWQPDKLLAKADAGARFIQLQLCMDLDVLRSYIPRLIDSRLTWRFQVLANIAVLPSVEEARAMRRDNPGAIVPAEFVSRLESAADPQAEGIAIAAEMIQQLQEIPGIAGVNLWTSADSTLTQAAIEQSGVRTRAPA
jgi:methylenetetrahydrofolate reductase (NADPH)